MTVPVLLTLNLAKFFIGISFILTNLAFYFYLQKAYLLPPLLLAGILEFYFINQENYQEWKVLGIYLLTIAMLITYIAVSNLCN